MKKIIKTTFVINIITIIYYVYISFLSLTKTFDATIEKIFGIKPDFYSIFLYSNKERKNIYSSKMRFNGIMEKYYWHHWEFVVYYKRFYPISIVILILSIIELIFNIRIKNDNKYRSSKIIVSVIFIFLTVIVTFCNIYYCRWEQLDSERGI